MRFELENYLTSLINLDLRKNFRYIVDIITDKGTINLSLYGRNPVTINPKKLYTDPEKQPHTINVNG